MEGLRDYEKKLMIMESGMEDLKITQDAAIDELSKFQIKIDLKVEREVESMHRKLRTLVEEIEKGMHTGQFDTYNTRNS
jgi:hypothetical protein